MKYKITVQPVGENAGDTPQKLQDGILVEGYLLIADHGEYATTVIQKMSIGKIADTLAGDNDLMKAVEIARIIKNVFYKQKEA